MHAEIKSLGVSLLMVSPQTQEHSRTVAEEKGLSMEVLSDPGNRAAEKYGLVYRLPGDLKDV